MTSQINVSNINADFPVAGQDNDSQGFRTNFDSIKTGLETATTEISALQTNTAKTNADNDFAENKIKKAILQDVSEEVQVLIKSSQEVYVDVDYEIAAIHKITVSAPTTNLRFINWPDAGTYGRVIVHLLKNVGSGDPLNISINTDVGGIIKVDSTQWGAYRTIQVGSVTEPTIIELYSYDAGNTVYVNKYSYVDLPAAIDPNAGA